MKRLILIFMVCALVFSLFSGCSKDLTKGFTIENGMAQPILKYTDAQSEVYTNEGSDILRFVVYVETDYDTDADGKPDLVKALVQVPRPAAEGKMSVPAIYEARPYIAGMYGLSPNLPDVGASDFDVSTLNSKPEKRKVSKETTSLEHAKTADPKDWYYNIETDPFYQQYMQNLTAYDYYLVRGFAVVECAGLGTWGSEGIECCTSVQETEAFKCVIEWLTGDRNAFTDLTSNIKIKADWCSGKVGMTGRSYAGALAFELASTGIKGLETVVPVAGPASWYEYANSQGAPNGLLSEYDFIADLAAMCASGYFVDPDPDKLKRYENYLAAVRDEQVALEGDFGSFWQEREYSNRKGFKASALIVQGLSDETVHPKQFDLMREAFLGSGCEVKCLLHRNGHVTPANEQTKTDIMIGDHTYTEWLNL
ncbi:MAG: X-prolyl-dipeptidyl aminopeptidase, partial [Clostridia bacterium]|nr:X-prolyl-dipeptidyl aminopeptidase [Clostridia bacterium]